MMTLMMDADRAVVFLCYCFRCSVVVVISVAVVVVVDDDDADFVWAASPCPCFQRPCAAPSSRPLRSPLVVLSVNLGFLDSRISPFIHSSVHLCFCASLALFSAFPSIPAFL